MSKAESYFKRAVLAIALAVILLPVAGVVLQLLSVHRLSEAAAIWSRSVNGRHMALLFNSVVFSGLVALVSAALGALLALVLMQNKAGRHVLTYLLVPLVIIPPTIHGLNWSLVMIHLNEWLSGKGLAGMRMEGWLAAGCTEILSFLPVGIAVAWAGFAALDARLLEAGLVYRAPAGVFAGIAVRLAAPLLWAGAGVIFLLSISDYAVPSLFSVNVYALEIYSTFSSGIHPAAAVFTALPLVAVAACIVTVILKTGRHARSMAFNLRTPFPSYELGMPMNLAPALLMLLYFSIPLVIMISMAGSWNYLAIAAAGARSEIAVSCALSLATALLCMLFGLAVGRALERGGPGSPFWWAVICTAFALPAPLIGMGILHFAGLSGARFEDLLPLWACTARFLPVAAFIFHAFYRRSDESLLEAAGLFGHNYLHVLRKVSLPLMLPGLVISAATCFSFAMGELGATLMVAAPGRATLMMRLYNLLHYGASRDVAALSLMLMIPVLAAGALLLIVLNGRTASPDGEPAHA
jgi:iron(III) transport system permease protein